MQFASNGRIFAGLFVLAVNCFVLPGSAQEIMLSGERNPEGVQRIRQKVEITGQLNLNPHGKGITEVPLKVTANTDFQQRILSQTPPLRGAILSPGSGPA